MLFVFCRCQKVLKCEPGASQQFVTLTGLFKPLARRRVHDSLRLPRTCTVSSKCLSPLIMMLAASSVWDMNLFVPCSLTDVISGLWLAW
ncbi:hypothetical protein PAXRUDRAFT_361302 [Paxillus rubicundulus Ve08.2h10]|uniref:Uncharacterized protein n=1 Tax=Paxillus rubicundulus Ve08.2h10 TaxID=930991 RepID=A0A0D0DMS5_9AGAM|nr:hypothetical protein PAXRUDRAFT_361302 [Paxillus rubicundulus Ve08.2h10]